MDVPIRRGGLRRGAVVASSILLAISLVGLTGLPSAADVFANNAPITIPAGAPGTTSGPASPYPSSIVVSGLSGTIVDVNVTLNGYSHTFPDDVDVLLDAPFGPDVLLMTQAGGATDAVSVDLTFDDAAAATLPNGGPIVSGTFLPSNFSTWSGTPPAPAGPHATALSALNGTDPNGAWHLYVYDQFAADTGSISGGWSIDVQTNAPTITSFSPDTGPPGTSVTINGTNLSGATSVTFGGALAAFTPVSAVQIMATVPTDAVTGTISVTTPNGTAVSSTVFTVESPRHTRKVTLRVGNKAKGRVKVPDGFTACAMGVKVKVQHREGGRWRRVGTDLTNDDGQYVVPGTRDPGRYRAIAKKTTLASSDICLKAVRKVRK